MRIIQSIYFRTIYVIILRGDAIRKNKIVTFIHKLEQFVIHKMPKSYQLCRLNLQLVCFPFNRDTLLQTYTSCVNTIEQINQFQFFLRAVQRKKNQMQSNSYITAINQLIRLFKLNKSSKLTLLCPIFKNSLSKT